MRNPERTFIPFFRLVIPAVEGAMPETALSLARSLGGRTQVIGLVSIPEEDSLSGGAAAAHRLRKQISGLRNPAQGVSVPNRVLVSHDPWTDLKAQLAADPPDLLILEWPLYGECLGISLEEALRTPVCNIALVRGPWPERVERVLAPVRGGPNAELALRLSLALPRQELRAIHLVHPGPATGADAPFLGLQRVLPNLPDVTFQTAVSADPVASILESAYEADVLVVGASSSPSGSAQGSGVFLDKMLRESPSALVVMKNPRPFPTHWTGPEAERSGAEAISLLVDRWFAENTFHADEFDDLERLVECKREQNLTISLALPALNEEETVGEVIHTVKKAMMDDVPLLDEIVLMDSNSTDRTREIAASLGIPVYIHQHVLPAYEARRGKGEALWKSLYVTHGDLLVWIDTDIVNIDPRFVYGVIGPLLLNPRLQFVKGFYQRPLRSGETMVAGGGGRVTELTARPLLNLFYPELSGVIQPLSGEYGGRRSALERLPFFSGYGVEVGLLIGIFEMFGLSAIAQVDLLERVHHNQSLEALSKMSFTIIQAILHKLEKRYQRAFLEEINKTMKLIRYEEGNYFLQVEEMVERERPAIIELAEYLHEHGAA